MPDSLSSLQVLTSLIAKVATRSGPRRSLRRWVLMARHCRMCRFFNGLRIDGTQVGGQYGAQWHDNCNDSPLVIERAPWKPSGFQTRETRPSGPLRKGLHPPSQTHLPNSPQKPAGFFQPASCLCWERVAKRRASSVRRSDAVEGVEPECDLVQGDRRFAVLRRRCDGCRGELVLLEDRHGFGDLRQ